MIMQIVFGSFLFVNKQEQKRNDSVPDSENIYMYE